MKVIYGIGVNDSQTPVSLKTNHKITWRCPYYDRWKYMINRCYSGRFPSYSGTFVCEEWLRFSNFKTWMEQQRWEGSHLDKDLLGDGSLYSPETCIFVPQGVNKFVLGIHPMSGVTQTSRSKPYASRCNNLLGQPIYLGNFLTKESAHQAWVTCKTQLLDSMKPKLDSIHPNLYTSILTRIV